MNYCLSLCYTFPVKIIPNRIAFQISSQEIVQMTKVVFLLYIILLVKYKIERNFSEVVGELEQFQVLAHRADSVLSPNGRQGRPSCWKVVRSYENVRIPYSLTFLQNTLFRAHEGPLTQISKKKRGTMMATNGKFSVPTRTLPFAYGIQKPFPFVSLPNISLII